MKTVYEVWSQNGKEKMISYQCISLKDAGFRLGKLISIGVTCWLQIKTE